MQIIKFEELVEIFHQFNKLKHSTVNPKAKKVGNYEDR